MACSNGSCNGCSGCTPQNVSSVPIAGTNINKIIGILSGKGGVGKTMVSSLIAVGLAKAGYRVGIMDADITGPSIPKMFGLEHTEVYGDENGISPLVTTDLGIKVISVNMMLPDDEDPALWRGPIIGNMIKQFYTNVYWDELDYLIIDMPPGTSDVALNVVQEIPIDGLIMVTNPGRLVNMIVAKTIKMAQLTKVKVIGLVENMSYIKCDDCGHEIHIYDEAAINDIVSRYHLEILAKIPLDPKLGQFCELGNIEAITDEYLSELIKKL